MRTWLGVAGILLLAVPGFAIGLFAGVLWREPGLVASHVFGETREVVWSTSDVDPASEPRTPSDVAAAPPFAALPQGVLVRLAVQVGAFGDAASAEKLAATLRRKGFAAFVSPSTGEADSRWRVRVGPMTSRDEADRVAGRLKAEERLPTWVVEDGRS